MIICKSMDPPDDYLQEGGEGREGRGMLQNKNQLFNVPQVNFNVVTIYKHGGGDR